MLYSFHGVIILNPSLRVIILYSFHRFIPLVIMLYYFYRVIILYSLNRVIILCLFHRVIPKVDAH